MSNVVEFPVERSNHVAKLVYNPESRRFSIQFKDQSSETYEAVPPHVFAEMTRSPSIGTYYHGVIKRHYKRIERKGKPNGSRNR